MSDESGHVTTVSAINGSQATAVGAGGLTMETRTWVDQPTWTREGVKWRVEELRAKGYQVSSATYDDWQYLYFTATFYYDKYGKPSSLTRTVHAMGGVDQTEPNPEMFRRTTGEMIGSSLKVEYIYSVKEGKWMRCQTAVIPPGATSPIHLAANQIPNGTEPPYRYTDAGELSADILEDSPFTPEEEAVFRLMATSAANRKGGMNWGVKLDKVQDSTYNGMALSATGYLGSKWVGAAKKLHKVTLGDERQIVDVGKLKFVQGSYSVSAEESIVTGVSWMAGQVPQGQATKFGDIGGIREQLLANYKYYSDLEKNPSYAYRASLGKKETKQLLEELGDLESAIGMAGVQDAFTQNVTAQLSGASGIIGLFGGPIGAEASFAIDLYSTFLKAANDTNNADVQEAVQRFLGRVDGYKASDSERKRDMQSSEQEKKDYNNEIGFPIHSVDENVFNDPFSDSYKPPVTAETTPVHDPSGVIYEGVIENPVADATVTLWRYDESESTQSLVRHDDSAYLGQANPLASDGSGHYSWDVPEGLWYVTAEKDGYAAGSSRNDVAATENRSVNDEPMRFLPVLPPQLDVNIPLVDASAPKVADVRYTTGGIYVTFSKYMTDTDGGADSVLNPASYSLCSVSPEAAIAIERVTPVERGHAPANVDSAETTYTRTVLLETREPVPAGTALTLTVSGAVTSYAGTAMGENHTENGTAAAQEQTAEPVLSVASGTVARNSAVEITCADRDAVIYYTTDGKEPTAGSKRYDGPIPINGSMTVKAIAVSVGRADSSVSSASFAVTAEALDPGSLSAAVTAGGVTVRFTPPEGSTYAKGFCAVFGEFGQLLGVAPLTVSAAEQTLTVTCDSAKASSVRVFFLDGNSVPVYDYMSAPVSR